ncbi:hypothetical protein WJX72_011907 [[Myrmecia] bisecta]|uniref:Uncharacterized protein n=1 Tax=[Myrmecia] bisecta TaxID=41462 RepID=A0AAW1PSU4_9CHLO
MVVVDDKRNLFVHDSLRQLARTVAVEQPRALWSLAEHVPEDRFEGSSAANRLQLSDLGGLGSLAEPADY